MKKNTYPIPFHVALRQTIGGRSVPDRMRKFRQYWLAELKAVHKQSGHLFAPFKDTTIEAIEYLKREGFDELDYTRFRNTFPVWLKERDRSQRSDAAKARWDKPKKILARKTKRKK